MTTVDLTLAIQVRDIEAGFLQTISALNSRHASRDTRQLFEALQDGHERFKLWTGSLGAHHPPSDQRSLEYRTRNAPQIARRLTELLRELQGALGKASLPHRGEHGGLPSNPHILDQEDRAILDFLELPDSQESEIAVALHAVADVIRRLFKISSLIGKSTARDRYAKAESSADARFQNSFDLAHVKHKFADKTVDAWLLERLGKAITKRRQYLMYSREHRDRLAQPSLRASVQTTQTHLSVLRDLLGPGSEMKSKVGDSTSSLQFTTASTLGPVRPLELDDGVDDSKSVSTMASSFVQEDSDSALRVIGLEEICSPGQPFECPYCPTLQTFKRYAAWRKHVFSDLRAYVCTFQECGMRMFETREAWQAHELEKHRRQWRCHLCSFDTAAGERQLSNHLLRMHSVEDDHSQLLLSISSQPLTVIDAKCCPLCDWDVRLRPANTYIAADSPIAVSADRFFKHLGRHLEQLALFAVPRAQHISESDGEAASNEPAPTQAGSTHREQLEEMSDSGDSLGTDMSAQARMAVPDIRERSPTQSIAAVDSHEGDDVTRCVCGLQDYPGLPDFESFDDDGEARAEDSGALFIQCDGCSVWQHGGCVTISAQASQSLDEYSCEKCQPKLHDIRTDSRGQRYSLYRPQLSKIQRARQETNAKSASAESFPDGANAIIRDFIDEDDRLRRALDEFDRDVQGEATMEPDKRDRYLDPIRNNDAVSVVEDSIGVVCPIPTCGRQVEDLNAHMLTHQNDRSEKCPIATCEYHTTGFARKNDKNRHLLSHYKGTMVCEFCPGISTAAEKSFNRVDVFKRHLIAVHGVEQITPHAHRKTRAGTLAASGMMKGSSRPPGTCSTCGIAFADAQDFYEHLDDCVLRAVQQADPGEVANERRMSPMADDNKVQDTLSKFLELLPTSTGESGLVGDEMSTQSQKGSLEIVTLSDAAEDPGFDTRIALNDSLDQGVPPVVTSAPPPRQSQHYLDPPTHETSSERTSVHPATFQCTLCPRKFTRAYNLRSHLRTHTDERPFVCNICGKAFARQHDRKRHEGLHSGEKKFVCRGSLEDGSPWGCGRKFARADALGRHFRSEPGRVCIKPLLDEEAASRQKAWMGEQQQAQARAGMMAPQPMMNQQSMNMWYSFLPAALLQQYPALAGIDWNAMPQGPPPDDDFRSFEAGAPSEDEFSFDMKSEPEAYVEPINEKTQASAEGEAVYAQ